jgi:hypothetical protein
MLRLRSVDPSFTGISADPVSVIPTTRADGSFAIAITAKEKGQTLLHRRGHEWQAAPHVTRQHDDLLNSTATAVELGA